MKKDLSIARKVASRTRDTLNIVQIRPSTIHNVNLLLYMNVIFVTIDIP